MAPAPQRTAESTVISELVRLLDSLPPSKQREVLTFARFLRQQVQTEAGESAALRPVPADTLVPLTGVVALGGDAVADTEALYDGT